MSPTPFAQTLIDVDQGTHDTEMVVDAASSGFRGDAEWSVRMSRLSGGLSDGVDIIWLDNGCTKLAIVPTRGMGIWKGSVAGMPLQWNSPVERPVHPAFVDPMRRGGIGWLDGFNEVVCRCGLGWHGAPGTEIISDDAGNTISEQFLPLHGRIANLSAHHVRVDVSADGRISVTGVVDEASMFGGKLRLTAKLSTHIGSNTFEISDTVQNLGGGTADVEMLYHCNFGRPLLEKGATIHVAARNVAPRDARAAEDTETWTTYKDPTFGYTEQCYFADPVADADGRALAVLANSDRTQAVALRFDVSTLPWFTTWKNTQAEADGYCTGLEPGTGFPNLRSFERRHGRVVSLAADQAVTFELAISGVVDHESVTTLIDEVATLQTETATTIHPEPRDDWSA